MSYVSSTSTSYANVFKHDPDVIGRDITGSIATYAKWKIYGSTTSGAKLTVRATTPLGQTICEIETTGLTDIDWSEVTTNQLIYTESLLESDGLRDGLDYSITFEIKSSNGDEVRLFGITMVEGDSLSEFYFGTVEFKTGLSNIFGLAGDPNLDVIYYSTKATSGGIYSITTDGVTTTTLASGVAKAGSIKTDGVNVYWADNDGSQAIHRVVITGGTPESLYAGAGISNWTWIGLGSTKVYASSGDYANIVSIPKAGAESVTTECAAADVADIIEDGTNIYYGPTNSPGGKLMYRVLPPTGSELELTSGTSKIYGMADDGDNLFITRANGTMSRIDKATGEEFVLINTGIIPSGKAYGVAVDKDGNVYTADIQNGIIYKTYKTW